jgi:hypothetical protein
VEFVSLVLGFRRRAARCEAQEMRSRDGWMGIAVRSSAMKFCRFALRSEVSARAAPCASSTKVTTEIPTSVSPILSAMEVSIWRAFLP